MGHVRTNKVTKKKMEGVSQDSIYRRQIAVGQEKEEVSSFARRSRVKDGELGIIDGAAANICHRHFHSHAHPNFRPLPDRYRLYGARMYMYVHYS